MLLAQNADADPRHVPQFLPGGRAVLNADQDQRRIKRYRDEGAGCHAFRHALDHGADGRHARGETAERVPQGSGIEDRAGACHGNRIHDIGPAADATSTTPRSTTRPSTSAVSVASIRSSPALRSTTVAVTSTTSPTRT